MNVLGRLWIWLKRFRYRRGYGVHSPFAFNFLTYVVYERGEYYAYRDLMARYPVPFFHRRGHEVKCRKFLFRLANYVHPAVIRTHGRIGEADEAYLLAGSRKAAVWRDGARVAERPGQAGGNPAKELVVVGREVPASEWPVLAGHPATDDSVCVLFGIHASGEALQAWAAVKRLPEVVVTFDLYDYGLVFYDRSKQRQDYMVNF